MLNRLKSEARLAVRSFSRQPGFAVPALVSAAFAVGLGLAIFGSIRIESTAPLQLRSALALDRVRDAGWSLPLRSAARVQEAGLERALLFLAGLALLALLIACLNLTILTLMRATGRRREAAVRAALGEPRSRLWLRSAAEGVALAGAGIAAGAVAGLAGGALLLASWPHAAADLAGLLPQVWGLAICIAGPTAALVLPPLAATLGSLRRRDWSRWLTVGERATAEPVERLRRSGLAVTQIAGALVLLVAAGLLVRDSVPTRGGELGYDPADTLLVELDLPGGSKDESGERPLYYNEVLAAVSELEGVESAALSSPGTWVAVGAEGVATAECGDCYVGNLFVPISPAVARHHAVSPGSFAAMRANLIDGREFDDGDDADAPLRALVNRTFAENHFQDGEAVGRRVQLGGARGRWYTVVGVVDEVRAQAIGSAEPQTPAVYLSLLQSPVPSVDLLVRSSAPPDALEAALAAALASIDEAASHVVRGGLEERLRHQAAPLRWLGYVFAVLAALSLLIAIYGLAAVMRYEVLQRRAEIATRTAVGATPLAILALLVRRTLRLTAVGVGVGSLLALPLVGWLQTIAPQIDPIDPALFGLVIGSLAAATILGAVRPAWIAARLDPMIILRGS